SIVESLAKLLDLLGLNGTRFRWKWRQRRLKAAESGVQAEMLFRSAKGKHRMCTECRALVPRSASTCPECGEQIRRGASRPGAGRIVGNLFPGISRATSLLMLANGFWFVLMLMSQIRSGNGGGIFGGFDIELLMRFGAGLGEPHLIAEGFVSGGEWWRLITPIFIHGGLIHLFMNTLFLMNLGPTIEDLLETDRFWVVYLVSGVAGATLSESYIGFLVRGGWAPTVGASGALLGLMGFLIAYGYREGGAIWSAVKAMLWRMALFLLVITFFVGSIDHLGHLGGLLAGGAFGFFVKPGRLRGSTSRAVWAALAVVGVIVTITAFYFAAQLAQQVSQGIP
ncbi:MAG: rhomboid family intramembrane serine protease, partial [Acidobacteriota bacterium]|nr:rhomboid family intramembrane serine protease [Acidobacteriota bacterium]